MQHQILDSWPEASPEPISQPSTADVDSPITTSLESHDTRPCSSQEGDESIHDKLWERVLHDCRDAPKKFLSLDAQEEIINVDSVRRDLARHLSLGPIELDELVAFICPEECGGSGFRQGKKLFAVLALIDQLGSILVFKKGGIDDSHLPFKRNGTEKLIPRNYSGSLELFQGWRSKAMMDFENYQWYTLTPFLQPSSLHFLDDGVIMPWTQCERIAEGGQSYVYRVKIHDAHHIFPRRKASGC